ncbi:MBL fold metallo-hydrolase [[Eubacterium] cellulosolvens]
MKLKIIYDNEANEGFKKDWGFSCLIGDSLLFDTGANLNTLLYNMRKFKINFKNIEKIIFSHEHGDHIGGYQILDKLGEVEVFILSSFSVQFKKELSQYSNVTLIEIAEAEEIVNNIFTTGEIGYHIKEQSLIININRKLTVITGCSHPGLENILRISSRLGIINNVVGGFHDFNKLEVLRKMQLIVPCHCTVRKKKILELFPESSVKCSAGSEIEI